MMPNLVRQTSKLKAVVAAAAVLGAARLLGLDATAAAAGTAAPLAAVLV